MSSTMTKEEFIKHRERLGGKVTEADLEFFESTGGDEPHDDTKEAELLEKILKEHEDSRTSTDSSVARGGGKKHYKKKKSKRKKSKRKKSKKKKSKRKKMKGVHCQPSPA